MLDLGTHERWHLHETDGTQVCEQALAAVRHRHRRQQPLHHYSLVDHDAVIALVDGDGAFGCVDGHEVGCTRMCHHR